MCPRGREAPGQTLGQLVEDALRRELSSDAVVPGPPVPVFRGGGGPAGDAQVVAIAVGRGGEVVSVDRDLGTVGGRRP